MSGPTKTPQLTLHHLNNSRSERLFWLCEELGLPYEVKVYLRTPILAPPELKQIHPLGKAPVLVDGEQTIAESGTIVDYLLQTYSPTRPTFSLPDNYFSHYAEGSLMLYLQMGLVFTGSAKNAPWLVSGIIQGFANKVKSSYIDKTLRQHFDFLETELGKSPTGWFGHSDSPTAADYMMLYPIHAVITNPSRVEGLTIGPNIQTWWDKVQAREAYQRGVARLEQEEAKAKDAKDAGALRSKL